MAYSFFWEPGHSKALSMEADLEVIGYVEQYLRHHGVMVKEVVREGIPAVSSLENNSASS